MFICAFFSNRRLKPPRAGSAAPFLAAAGCLALPPELLHQALAMTAGTLFESVPFVLAVSLGRGRAVRWAAALLGCGCGRAAGPGALSLPAAALCWAIFGPLVAGARFVAALALHWAGRRSRGHAHGAAAGTDPLADLWSIAVPAFVLALGTTALRGMTNPGWMPDRPILAGIVEAAAGLAGGALAPCVTAAIALAGMVRTDAPLAAAGLLVSAGLVPRLRAPRTARRAAQPARDARLGLALVAIACALLAVRGGSGFVHPRLLPLVWLAPAGALALFARRPATAVRFGSLAPAAMLAALVLGSPLPLATIGGSSPDDLYPGASIAFDGAAEMRDGRVTLVRFAIACCRADATAILVPTNLKLRITRDTWLAIRGTVVTRQNAAVVDVSSWKRIAKPNDPYLYL